jgi:hypothetical protein
VLYQRPKGELSGTNRTSGDRLFDGFGFGPESYWQWAQDERPTIFFIQIQINQQMADRIADQSDPIFRDAR